MKNLKVNELTEIKFQAKHPFDDGSMIICRANVKTLEDGRLEVVDMYYVDPRHPDKEVAYHSKDAVKKPTIDGDSVTSDTDNKDGAPTPEEVKDMAVDAYVHSHMHNHIIEILIDNNVCERHVVLSLLGAYWDKYPQLRLAQIVSNAWHIHPDYKKNPEPDIQDIFYLSDDKFLEGLELLTKDESKDQGSTQG